MRGEACLNFFLCVTSKDRSVKFREAVKNGDPDIVKHVHGHSEFYQMGL